MEDAQQIGPHPGAVYESPRTTKLYGRTSDAISLDEIEQVSV